MKVKHVIKTVMVLYFAVSWILIIFMEDVRLFTDPPDLIGIICSLGVLLGAGTIGAYLIHYLSENWDKKVL